jgi:hypothetical protein
MPRASLDAPEDLPKQALRQVAFGKPEDEGSRRPDEAPAGHVSERRTNQAAARRLSSSSAFSREYP